MAGPKNLRPRLFECRPLRDGEGHEPRRYELEGARKTPRIGFRRQSGRLDMYAPRLLQQLFPQAVRVLAEGGIGIRVQHIPQAALDLALQLPGTPADIA